MFSNKLRFYNKKNILENIIFKNIINRFDNNNFD